MGDIKDATRYKIISQTHEVDKLIKACKQTGYCSFDFETNAEKLYRGTFYPTILSVTFEPGSSIIIPLKHFESPFRDNGIWLKALRRFGRAVIEDPNIVKVGWNLKFDNQIMMLYGINPKGRIFDAMLAKYILDEERPNDLKSMVEKFYPKYGGYQEDYPGCKLPWAERPLQGLSQYGAIDSDMALRLFIFFESKLMSDKKFYSLYRNLYCPASKVLTSMEIHGMRLNKPFNDQLKIKYAKELDDIDRKIKGMKKVRKFQLYLNKVRTDRYIEKIEEEIDTIKREKISKSDTKALNSRAKKIASREAKISKIYSGELTTKDELKLVEPLNLNSTPQLIELFFLSPKGFKFPIIKYTQKDKKDTDNPSTAEDVLLELKKIDKTGFIDLLLKNRGLSTINSTFVHGIAEALQDDGMVHPSFFLHTTVTSRLSCVSGDTKILTNRGEIPIKDLCPQDIGYQDISGKRLKTYTHNNRWCDITHAINKGVEEMYRVELEDGSFIECTLEHIFITSKGELSLKDIIYLTSKDVHNTITLYKLL